MDKNRNCWLYYAHFFLTVMALFLNIYILVYTLTLCALYYLLNSTTSLNSNTTLASLLYQINTISKLKSPILMLLTSLSGLPPFFLFFIKFNYLTYILFSLNPFISLLVFITLFINMLYYIQVFFFKSELHEYTRLTVKNKKINYKLLYNIYLYLFFILFSIFFVTDFIYILKLI